MSSRSSKIPLIAVRKGAHALNLGRSHGARLACEAVVSGAGGAKGLWTGRALAFKEAAVANRALKEMESASQCSLAYPGTRKRSMLHEPSGLAAIEESGSSQ
jgi:hypothetical protein